MLGEKVTVINELEIDIEKLKKEINKRKNRTTPGIELMEYKTLGGKSQQQPKLRAFKMIIYDNSMIPGQRPTGRTILLEKTKYLNDKKNYQPITSYQILTGLIVKYMFEHTLKNKIQDKGQLGVVEGVPGTVYQLIIDRCILEEIKHYYRNLVVAFYDQKKVYDKVHNDWMLHVYQWIGIPKEEIELIYQLMIKWKIRLKIWNKGEKITCRSIEILCQFLQGRSYSPVGFCVPEILVCKLPQQSKGYRMGEP